MIDVDRYRGALLGLTVCDALGTTVEFRPPGTFQPLTDIVGGGPFQLKPGQWTDDTSMALCLAESLIEKRGFDPVDQLERYVRWYRDGHLSSTGACFDIGGTTSQALHQFERTHKPYCGSTEPRAAGNGSIMRFHRGKDFQDGALLAVNLGDDADTTGAVYGQIAGAFYGYDGIPQQWCNVIAERELIIQLADNLKQDRP